MNKITEPFRWKYLHQKLMKTDYVSATDTSQNQAAYWDNKKNDWYIPGGLNCITAVNFFLGYMLKKGGSGKGYEPKVGDNLVKAYAQRKGFSTHFDELVLTFKGSSTGGMSTDTAKLSLLSNRSPNYKGVDRPPWWEMPLELTKEATCQCGLHVSVKYVLNRKHMLSRVNVASVSLPAFTPAGGLTK